MTLILVALQYLGCNFMIHFITFSQQNVPVVFIFTINHHSFLCNPIPSVIKHWTKSLDFGRPVGVMNFDFHKAFDSIPNKIGFYSKIVVIGFNYKVTYLYGLLMLKWYTV